MIAIFLRFIGVFGGLVITGIPFVIMMTMVGIIHLPGLLFNMGLVILVNAQVSDDRKKKPLDLEETDLY